MTSKLYIAGIGSSTTESEVENAFKIAGTVRSVQIHTSGTEAQENRFGFVEMGTEEEAANAIKLLNNTAVNGEVILVEFARRPLSGVQL